MGKILRTPKNLPAPTPIRLASNNQKSLSAIIRRKLLKSA